MFQAPVAKGNEDAVELQALALVDRQDAQAIVPRALDGFTTDGRLPFADEIVDIGAIVKRKLAQLVIERTNVSALIVNTFQLEDTINLLSELVKWHTKHLFVAVEEAFGEQAV